MSVIVTDKGADSKPIKSVGAGETPAPTSKPTTKAKGGKKAKKE